MSGNFLAARPFVYIAGNIIDPAQNNDNEGTIYLKHNESMDALAGHSHTGLPGDGGPLSIGPSSIDLTANYPWTGSHSWSAPGTFTLNNGGTFNGTVTSNGNFVETAAIQSMNAGASPSLSFATVGAAVDDALGTGSTWFITKTGDATFNSVSAITITGGVVAGNIPPIGSIIPFYDFAGALTFNALFFAYCDGTVKTIAGIGAQTLPDLSGRYLVGFGTDGGGNIGTAPFATPPVGNTGNTINIQHDHTGPSHQHGAGTLQFQTGNTTANAVTGSNSGGAFLGPIFEMYNSGGGAVSIAQNITYDQNDGDDQPVWNTVSNTTANYFTKNGSGATASSGTGVTGNALSTTQSIQPISIRVRFIMRIA